MDACGNVYLSHEDNPEDQIISLYNFVQKVEDFAHQPPHYLIQALHIHNCPHATFTKVDDTIESIMYRGIVENAFPFKWAGGLGGSWDAVARGTGSHIAGTNGESLGVIPFLKMHNDQLVQLTMRVEKGLSGCAYLESWHCDIIEFLELRKNTGDDRAPNS